jgi:hypothetical protein
MRIEADRPVAQVAAEMGISRPTAYMRARAEVLAPDHLGVLKDPSRFFRQGLSGTGRQHLTNSAFGRYQTRTASLAPADLLEWLHRPERPAGTRRRSLS